MRLLVEVGGVLVGWMTRHGEGATFDLAPSYLATSQRPVLGQAFEDDPSPRRTRARIPAWFSNLLPEGPLRELVAAQAGVHTSRELFLLRHLGRDLPGSVVVTAGEPSAEEGEEEEWSVATSKPDEAMPLKFSLAGVQLKLSVLRSSRGLTVPVAGQGGNWIAKLDDPRFPAVPATERATMAWAARSGISVPTTELVAAGDIAGLPAQLRTEQLALLVERFDRSPDGRVHQEDLAQVLEVFPHDKYRAANFETVVRLVRLLAGVDDAHAVLRRLVFNVIAGNGDAHLKNWSLTYPDGIGSRLAPAYDLVPTVLYQEADDLGLNFAGSKDFARVSLDSFQRLAARVGLDEAQVLETATEAVRRVVASWREEAGDFGFRDADVRLLTQRMRSLRLVQEADGP